MPPHGAHAHAGACRRWLPSIPLPGRETLAMTQVCRAERVIQLLVSRHGLMVPHPRRSGRMHCFSLRVLRFQDAMCRFTMHPGAGDFGTWLHTRGGVAADSRWSHVPIHHLTQEGPALVLLCSLCHPTACSRSCRHHGLGHRRCGGRSAPDGFDTRVISSLNLSCILRRDVATSRIPWACMRRAPERVSTRRSCAAWPASRQPPPTGRLRSATPLPISGCSQGTISRQRALLDHLSCGGAVANLPSC